MNLWKEVIKSTETEAGSSAISSPKKPEMTDSELKTVVVMAERGGGFVKCLARAMMAADPENFAILKAGFPVYWEKYTKMAEGIYP